RRRQRELASGERKLAVAAPTASSHSPLASDLRPVIDDELARLPDKLRAAVVLCDLGGKSRSEAARQLGLPERTVATRLAKAPVAEGRGVAGRPLAPPRGDAAGGRGRGRPRPGRRHRGRPGGAGRGRAGGGLGRVGGGGSRVGSTPGRRGGAKHVHDLLEARG